MAEVGEVENTEFKDEVGVQADNSKPELGMLGAADVSEASEPQAQLLGRPIEQAITKKVVSNVNIDRLDSIAECKSFLIDFSNNRAAVVPSWMQSLKNLILSDEKDKLSDEFIDINQYRVRRGLAELRADAALYIKTRGGLVLAGYVDSLQIYKILRDLIKISFGDTVKVYVGNGGKAEFREWKYTDVNGVRLRL